MKTTNIHHVKFDGDGNMLAEWVKSFQPDIVGFRICFDSCTLWPLPGKTMRVGNSATVGIEAAIHCNASGAYRRHVILYDYDKKKCIHLCRMKSRGLYLIPDCYITCAVMKNIYAVWLS